MDYGITKQIAIVSGWDLIRCNSILILVLCLISCQNDKPQVPKASSVQPNVTILEEPFTIPGLNRSRKIRLFLPQDYADSDQRYPVLYMQDGQNLFDDSTSYAGEWNVDEQLNRLEEQSGFQLIVVGIDHGEEHRLTEMSPWPSERFGHAEGKEFTTFIVHTLKPFIDSTYRTLADRENTAIMGSSMGGLISQYALYRYPEVFGKAGLFSPTIYTDSIFSFTRKNPVPPETMIFSLIGKYEAEMVGLTKQMHETIIGTGHPKANVKLVVDPEGYHNETLWRKHFSPAIQWLFHPKQQKQR